MDNEAVMTAPPDALSDAELVAGLMRHARAHEARAAQAVSEAMYLTSILAGENVTILRKAAALIREALT